MDEEAVWRVIDRQRLSVAGLLAELSEDEWRRIWYGDKYFGARTRWTGYRLAATDTSWSAGQGSPVEGPMDALLLLMTGRSQAAAARLTGV